MDVVGTMPTGLQASPFFNMEHERTPSPEKEEQEMASRVVDFRDLASSPAPRFFPGMVVDFKYLEDKFSKKVDEIEDPWSKEGYKAPEGLPELAVAEGGKVVELVEQEYIRALLKSPPSTEPLPHSRIEALRRKGTRDVEILASTYRNLQRGRDIQEDIIKQYLDKGYAYIALPVSSNRYPAIPAKLPRLP